MRFCFDLDNTILMNEGSYYKVEPRHEVIKLMHDLRKAGHTLIIYTARNMNTYAGNTHKVLANIASHTFTQLEEYDIPYDEIAFGKPSADAYIDDKAINALSFKSIEEGINGILNN